MATLYDRSVIPSVKSLEEAHDGIQTTSFDDCLSAFETLVKNCGQNDRYGLTLVHRHTDVEPNTRIFDFGNTLQTFPLQDDAEELHGAKIRPKSYALRGMWKPYEYELGVRDDADDLFLGSVKELLQQHKLDKYVGLRRYSPDDPEELEITEQWGISLKIPLDQVRIIQVSVVSIINTNSY